MLDAPIGPKVLACALSLSAHVGIAMVVTREPSVAAASGAVERSVVEIPAPELEPLAPAPPPAPEKAPSAPPTPIRQVTPPSARLAVPHATATATDDRSSLAPEPSVIDVPAAVAPRFVMTVGRALSSPGGAVSVDGGSRAPGVLADEPLPEAAADVPAKLVAGDPPAYTKSAEAAGIEADVPLEIVVDVKGAVVTARALAHVGYGLDEAALEGVQRYRFSPARRAGMPTPVRMRWLMRFQLK